MFAYEKYNNKNDNDNDESYLNVYGWYGIIPRDVISEFEKEYKIHVRYDVYDNNDVLEAKLLATNSGYDIVFPSFIPYAGRQSNLGVYARLDDGLVTSLNNISNVILEKFRNSNGNTNYLIPIFWGTVGIAIENNTLKKIIPNFNKDTYDLVLSEENIKKISEYGISFPEEFIDIFPSAMYYLELDYTKKNIDDIKKVKDYFNRIRPYISKFSSSTMINDLLMGTVCVAIGSSDNAYRAMQSSKNVGKDIRYILPKYGSMLWIDCVAIPKFAPHKKNAGKFIDFLLRPKIAARITEYSGILVTVKEAEKYYADDMKNNRNIYPDDETLKLLLVGNPSVNEKDREFDKYATRTWEQIKMNVVGGNK